MKQQLNVQQVGSRIEGSLYSKIMALAKEASAFYLFDDAKPLTLLEMLSGFMNHFNSELPKVNSGNNQHTEHAYKAEQRLDIIIIKKIDITGTKHRIVMVVSE